jgi:protein gp37
MSENSPIEWTDHTHNAWIGCTRVSPGCDNCYAAISTPSRALKVIWGPGKLRHRTASGTRSNPRKWHARHGEFFAIHGRRQRVFCASLSDWADNEVPVEWLVDLLELVRTTPDLDWLMLTKRIGNVMKRLQAAAHWIEDGAHEAFSDLRSWINRWIEGNPPANVWLGVTVVNQEEADRDIEKLLNTPAWRRFLSMEPLLGPVDLEPWLKHAREPCRSDTARIDEVIVGGESGHNARPMHPVWLRSLRNQCAAAGVAFFFKQWGEWMPADAAPGEDFAADIPHGIARVETVVAEPHGHLVRAEALMRRVGKRAAGRLLDGCIHDGSLAPGAIKVSSQPGSL